MEELTDKKVLLKVAIIKGDVELVQELLKDKNLDPRCNSLASKEDCMLDMSPGFFIEDLEPFYIDNLALAGEQLLNYNQKTSKNNKYKNKSIRYKKIIFLLYDAYKSKNLPIPDIPNYGWFDPVPENYGNKLSYEAVHNVLREQLVKGIKIKNNFETICSGINTNKYNKENLLIAKKEFDKVLRKTPAVIHDLILNYARETEYEIYIPPVKKSTCSIM